ncbi:MAG: chromosomal replication initiator protein DnaA [Alphaproteobacteria bacterium]|nr:chromosomal replication initiator protein DnaA [Alphaproteobacteria bacterium]
MGNVEQTFINLKEQLRQRVGEASFSSWLSTLAFHNFKDGCVTLSAPSKFSADYIKRNFQKEIFALFHESFSDVNELNITVHHTHNTESETKKIPSLQPVMNTNIAHIEPDWYIQSILNDTYTFDRFVIGESNEFACVASKRIAQSDQKLFNPYFIYAGVGLGKTHLLHAIAHEIQTISPNRRVLYTSVQRFFDSYVRLIKQNQVHQFKEQFKNVDVLLIDDFQFIDGKKSFQQEFLYILNSFVEQGKQIVISSNRPPNVLDLSPALKSRLISGLVADMGKPDASHRFEILQNKSDLLGTRLPESILNFLVETLPHNIRELEGGLRRVVAYAELMNRSLNLSDIKNALKDLISVATKTIDLDLILIKTSTYLGVRESEIMSKQRTHRIVYARRLVIYLATRLTDLSCSEIARRLGGKDHTTILYAVRAIEKEQKTTPQLFDDIQAIETIIKT